MPPVVTGDRITGRDPGEHALVLAGTGETGGSYVLAELEVRRPATELGDLRLPHHDLGVEVLHGHLALRVDGRTRNLAAGDRLALPAGCRHGWASADGEPVLVMVELRPGDRAGAIIGRLLGVGDRSRTALAGTPDA